MPSKSELGRLFPAIRPKLAGVPSGQGIYTSPDMLGPKQFKMAFGVAVSLHLFALFVWMLLPKTEVVDVQVQALSLKLADDGIVSAEDRDAMTIEEGNRSDIDAELAKMMRDPNQPTSAREAEKAMDAMNKAAEAQEISKHIVPPHQQAQVIQHFIRTPVIKAADSASNAAEREIVNRYHTLIALWLRKFQYMPEGARDKGITGEGNMHLLIDRRGNVRHYFLDQSTGEPELDQAAMDMVRRANPLPAVPNDYPAGEHFEFIIPIRFGLE